MSGSDTKMYHYAFFADILSSVALFRILLGVAVGCVRHVDAERLKYCDGLWVQAPARYNFSICQSYPTIPLTQPTAIPSTYLHIGHLENGSLHDLDPPLG